MLGGPGPATGSEAQAPSWKRTRWGLQVEKGSQGQYDRGTRCPGRRAARTLLRYAVGRVGLEKASSSGGQSNGPPRGGKRRGWSLWLVVCEDEPFPK